MRLRSRPISVNAELRRPAFTEMRGRSGSRRREPDRAAHILSPQPGHHLTAATRCVLGVLHDHYGPVLPNVTPAENESAETPWTRHFHGARALGPARSPSARLGDERGVPNPVGNPALDTRIGRADPALRQAGDALGTDLCPPAPRGVPQPRSSWFSGGDVFGSPGPTRPRRSAGDASVSSAARASSSRPAVTRPPPTRLLTTTEPARIKARAWQLATN
jgi:hypothetical protein